MSTPTGHSPDPTPNGWEIAGGGAGNDGSAAGRPDPEAAPVPTASERAAYEQWASQQAAYAQWTQAQTAYEQWAYQQAAYAQWAAQQAAYAPPADVRAACAPTAAPGDTAAGVSAPAAAPERIAGPAQEHGPPFGAAPVPGYAPPAAWAYSPWPALAQTWDDHVASIEAAARAASPSRSSGATSPSAFAVELVAPLPARSSRVWAVLSLTLIKLIALTPHLLILAGLFLAACFVFLVAEVAVLATARYPRGLHAFIAGVARWNVRVGAFALGLTDAYPPFTFGDSAERRYPVDLVLRPPRRSSRLWALNYFLSVITVAIFVDPSAALWLTSRTAATLPHVLILMPLWAAALIAWLIAQLIVVVRGAYPRGLHEFLGGTLRWSARVWVFWFGLQDKYPPFELTSAPRDSTPAAAATTLVGDSPSAVAPDGLSATAREDPATDMSALLSPPLPPPLPSSSSLPPSASPPSSPPQPSLSPPPQKLP